jgi:hypothetical protein
MSCSSLRNTAAFTLISYASVSDRPILQVILNFIFNRANNFRKGFVTGELVRFPH